MSIEENLPYQVSRVLHQLLYRRRNRHNLVNNESSGRSNAVTLVAKEHADHLLDVYPLTSSQIAVALGVGPISLPDRPDLLERRSLPAYIYGSAVSLAPLPRRPFASMHAWELADRRLVELALVGQYLKSKRDWESDPIRAEEEALAVLGSARAQLPEFGPLAVSADAMPAMVRELMVRELQPA